MNEKTYKVSYRIIAHLLENLHVKFQPCVINSIRLNPIVKLMNGHTYYIVNFREALLSKSLLCLFIVELLI